ncbi:unnamed protein product [Linum tenue]|uniref:Uncharacterized protein n=1 Tax=Linum tenue TaxID=586396 RepID=A0AAV0QLE2_9ROSI|nr:unnamed protein product [Linum tenue]
METMVMDGDLKGEIKFDLKLFLKSKPYYHRLGRVWKWSYLLHDPSGTGNRASSPSWRGSSVLTFAKLIF